MYVISRACSDPKPVKNKRGIKDKHLILAVLCLTLVDVIVLAIYTVVEWIITQFNVGTVPNKEKPNAVTGVSQYMSTYLIII